MRLLAEHQDIDFRPIDFILHVLVRLEMKKVWRKDQAWAMRHVVSLTASGLKDRGLYCLHATPGANPKIKQNIICVFRFLCLTGSWSFIRAICRDEGLLFLFRGHVWGQALEFCTGDALANVVAG